MRVKITELFNTKYFYVTTGKDLVYMLNTCVQLMTNPDFKYNVGNDMLGKVYDCFKVGAPVEFDLAGARITSDVTPNINLYATKGIVFVDSQDSWRNDILKENRSRLELASKITDTVPLPTLSVNGTALDLIRSLQKDVIYQVPVINKEINIPLCILIQIYRPSIKLQADFIAYDMLSFVAKRLTPASLSKWSEFYMITPEGIQIVDAKKAIHVQRLGYVNIDEASTVADFVPTDFGKVVLKDDPEFVSIASECIQMLKRYKNTRPKTLAEVLS